MSLSKNARAVFDCLPEDGTAISGGHLRWDTELGAKDFKAAKAELKEAGLVSLGRGRGGTVSRVPEANIEKVAPPPPSPKERMAIAREVKDIKSKAEQEWEERRSIVQKWAMKFYKVPAEKVNVGLYNNRLVIEIWNGKGARVGYVPEDVCLDLGVI